MWFSFKHPDMHSPTSHFSYFEFGVSSSYGRDTLHGPSLLRLQQATAGGCSPPGDQFSSPKLMAYPQFVVSVAAVLTNISLTSLCKTVYTGLLENVAVWNCEVEEMKEQFLRPLPSTATDRGAVGSSLTFFDVTLVLAVIQRLTSALFCRSIMNIRQHVHVTFVLPEYCCLVTNCPDSNINPFQLQCLASEVAWSGPNVRRQFIFYFVRWLCKSGKEKWLSIYII